MRAYVSQGGKPTREQSPSLGQPCIPGILVPVGSDRNTWCRILDIHNVDLTLICLTIALNLACEDGLKPLVSLYRQRVKQQVVWAQVTLSAA